MELEGSRKRLQDTENLFRKNLQLKETVDIDILVTSRNGDRNNHAIYQNNK